jgi:hypothetical protein
MGVNYKIVKSVKQASICQYHELDVEILHDAANPGKVLFRVSPPAAAELAIERFENGECLPARLLLDVHSQLHAEIKNFLYQFRLLSGGKPFLEKDRG